MSIARVIAWAARAGLMLFAAFLSYPCAADPAAVQDGDAQAPVLCVWERFIAFKLTGDLCFRNDDKDAALRALLEESISRIDVFIVENEPMAPSDLQMKKAEVVRRLMEPVSNMNQAEVDAVCHWETQSDGVMMYHRMQMLRPDEIRHLIDRVLAVPRKPMRDPCL